MSDTRSRFFSLTEAFLRIGYMHIHMYWNWLCYLTSFSNYSPMKRGCAAY